MFKHRYLHNNSKRHTLPGRRTFLLTVSGIALSFAVPRLLAQPRFDNNPFTLGITSGYLQPSQVMCKNQRAKMAVMTNDRYRRRYSLF